MCRISDNSLPEGVWAHRLRPTALDRACPLPSLSSGVYASCPTCMKSCSHREARFITDCSLFPWCSTLWRIWCWMRHGGLCSVSGGSHIQEAAAQTQGERPFHRLGRPRGAQLAEGLGDLGSQCLTGASVPRVRDDFYFSSPSCVRPRRPHHTGNAQETLGSIRWDPGRGFQELSGKAEKER